VNASGTGSLGAVGEHRVRLTDPEAQLNLRTVVELCAAGEVWYSEKTHRPSAATVHTVGSHLAHGDFYRDEAIASFAWPLLVQAGGLAKLEGGRLQLTAKGRTRLRKPPAEVIRQLATAPCAPCVIRLASAISLSRSSEELKFRTALLKLGYVLPGQPIS